MPRSSRIQTETLKHRKAYEMWARNGGGAGLAPLQIIADEFDVTLRSIKQWYASFDWRIRWKRLEQRIMTKEAKMTEEILLLTKERNRELIAQLVASFEREFLEGLVDVTKIADYERLIKLDLTLQGERTGDETEIIIISNVPWPGTLAPEETHIYERTAEELQTNKPSLPEHTENNNERE